MKLFTTGVEATGRDESGMAVKWIVLVEAAANGARDRVEPDDVGRLLEALDPGSDGGALHSPDRYALQVATAAGSPAEALIDVLARWADAVRQLGLPNWPLVRTEVLTPEELERDLENQHRDVTPFGGSSLPTADPGGDDHSHELLRRAFSDPLTGLLGREAFEHRVEAAVQRTSGENHAAVIYLDLDGFGSFNDRFGGAAGDEVLVAVAQRLAATLRPGDGLARFGGDGYGVLLDDTTAAAAVGVAARMLDAVRRPLAIQGHDVNLSASAGIALAGPGDDARCVVENAGVALALAKEAGGDRHFLFRPEMSHPAPAGRFVGTDALQDRLAHLLLMQDVAVSANEADTLEQAASMVMRQICAHVGCALGHLYISPAESSEAPSSSLWHMTDEDNYRAFGEVTDKLSSVESADLLGRVSAAGRPVWVPDLAADSQWLRRDHALAAGLVSAFALPVLVGSEVVAVLEFFARTRMEPTGSFLDVLASIGTQLGRVVERHRASTALRHYAEELRVSEERLREAQELARLGSWHYDLATGESTWSDEMCSLYGLEPGALLPDLDSALASVHPTDRARAETALSRLIDSGERAAEDVRIIRPDGQVRWHRVQGSVIRGEDGGVVAIYGTSQDITERKLVEEALREREGQLLEAQNAARLGWWERDLSTGRVTWSDEMHRLWGWEPGQKISFETFLATVEVDDRQRLLAEAARLRQTGESVGLDFRASVADGRQRWFRGGARLVHDEAGTPVKVVGTAQDVTEEKQTQEELRTAKELYQRILETAYEGIITFDAQDTTTFANPRMAQILGYSVEEMSGMPASAFADEETLAALSVHRQRRRGGISEHYETMLRSKDGAAVPVLISASPFFDDGDGRYAGALAMVTDVSVFREAEGVLHVHNLRGRRDGDDCSDRLPSS